jgi:hypothetical protein
VFLVSIQSSRSDRSRGPGLECPCCGAALDPSPFSLASFACDDAASRTVESVEGQPFLGLQGRPCDASMSSCRCLFIPLY